MPKTAAGDIYSAGIILKEIFARNGPFTECEDLTPKDIIEKVKKVVVVPYRPFLRGINCKESLLDLIREAWHEDPLLRPSAGVLQQRISVISPFKSTNVMDNMMRMMELYQNNLETMVKERTQKVAEEKTKADTLLYRLLPRTIAESMKQNKVVEAESYDDVTVCYSDIINFANITSSASPIQVVDILNALYTQWDVVISNYDIYRVETIDDAYLCTSGCPVRNNGLHVVEIANCALELLGIFLNFQMPSWLEHPLYICMGIHTGPCIAGVVGLSMPRYCLFGNAVTIATTIEQAGLPNRIHVTRDNYLALSQYDGYLFAERCSASTKESEESKTYWLIGRGDDTNAMLRFEQLSVNDEPRPKILPVTEGKPQPVKVQFAPAEEDSIYKSSTIQSTYLKK